MPGRIRGQPPGAGGRGGRSARVPRPARRLRRSATSTRQRLRSGSGARQCARHRLRRRRRGTSSSSVPTARYAWPRWRRPSCPSTRSVKALARSGNGQLLHRRRRVGTHHLRVLVDGAGRHGALAGRAAARRGRRTRSRTSSLLLVVIAAAGSRWPRCWGSSWRARRWRRSPASPARPRRSPPTPSGSSTERVEVHGSDELARLAQTFNARSTRSSARSQAQRNLVADASHELRTPIATVRANSSCMRDEELLSPEDREALRARHHRGARRAHGARRRRRRAGARHQAER